MTQDLKHVEKNAHKKDGNKDAIKPIPEKKTIVPTGPKKQVEEVKRDPKQEFQMHNYYLEYYGKEVLQFTGDKV